MMESRTSGTVSNFSNSVIVCIYVCVCVCVFVLLFTSQEGDSDFVVVMSWIVYPPDAKSQIIGKDPGSGKNWVQENGVIEDKMVR